ncbi:MAG: hypothetical protein DI570_00540 [Phenylobacterium zucineum]|nr:MAG: hypothetical protein DI570_00540 [Phenylobacterium zucineum]
MNATGARYADLTPPGGPLAVAALRTLGRQPSAAWAAWGLLLAAGLALDFSARAAGVDVGGERRDAGLWAYSALEDVLTAAISGWALCWLLTGAAPKGRGYGVFVLLMALTELYWDAAAHVFPGDEADAVEFLAGALGAVLMIGGGVFVLTRLMLWPIGALTGAPVTPGGSWGRMEGQVLKYFAAVVLLTFPVVAVSGTLFAQPIGRLGVGGAAETIAFDRVLATLETALATGVSAAMWRRRQGATSERLGDVFA